MFVLDAPARNRSESTTSSVHQRAELMSSISTLYAILIVVMGVVVPVTTNVNHRVPVWFEQVNIKYHSNTLKSDKNIWNLE